MSKSSNAITVQGLQKSFSDNHVLKDVSFSVPKGTMLALLGPNGAGKTYKHNQPAPLIAKQPQQQHHTITTKLTAARRPPTTRKCWKTTPTEAQRQCMTTAPPAKIKTATGN